MKKTTLYSFLISCIQLSAIEPHLTFDPDCLLQENHTERALTDNPLIACGLQLRALGLDAQYVDNVLEDLDGSPKQYIHGFTSMCSQYANAMTLPQKNTFINSLLKLSILKTNILFENRDIFLYFLPKDRIKIVNFSNTVELKILKEMCQLMFKIGVKIRQSGVSCGLHFSPNLHQPNFFHDIDGHCNSDILDLCKSVKAENAAYFNDWIEKLSDFDLGPPSARGRLVMYELILKIVQSNPNQPIEATKENVDIFKQAFTAEYTLFGRGSSILSSIAFKDFIVATEVFNFLQLIAGRTTALWGLNNKFKYFIDQEYLNHFKNVVNASNLRHNFHDLLSILYLLGKERWSEFEIFLRKYKNYFLSVSERSVYEALKNKLQDGQDISVEVFLGTELMSYCYIHRISFNEECQNQHVINARQFQRQSFLEEIDYYKQSIAFICSQRSFRETPTVLDALWSVINGVNK